MPKLFAIGDIHISHELNNTAFRELRRQPPGSGLILAGDVGEFAENLTTAFTKAKECFDHVFWVPGNHELYTMAHGKHEIDRLKGEAKYDALVELAQSYGVHTPEDPWMVWEDDTGTKAIIALCFTLYDYSFRPSHVPREKALEWAEADDTVATDEMLITPQPYDTCDAWCQQLCDQWERKFREYNDRYPGLPFVIVNHWTLRRDLVFIPLIPRFCLWCGTKRTEDWHRKGRFGESYPGAKVVVTGHLHVRRTDYKDGCRFEECSLGYPRQWEKARNQGLDVNNMLREILPGDEEGAPVGRWRPYG